MANITREDMVKRVASRFIRSQEEQQQQQGQQEQQQQGQQQQQALPQSGPGKSMVKGALDKVTGAFDSGDESTFHKELDNLLKVSKHGA
jgi:hypothetical protein